MPPTFARKLERCLIQWLDENTCAMLARWLLEKSERTPTHDANDSSSSGSQSGAHVVSDNFFTDQVLSPPAPTGFF
jgi:hypothetical protein